LYFSIEAFFFTLIILYRYELSSLTIKIFVLLKVYDRETRFIGK
jgi:hypothetical protein